MEKGSPKESNLFKALPHGSPQLKLTKKKKLVNPQISRQIPLEMGTGGGGGGGKKGGSGGKRPAEDKVDIEDHPSKNKGDDSSSETSLELNLDPQQLASVGLDRPLLRLRLMPRSKIIATAPGGDGSPPPMGGGTVTVPLPERPNGTGTNQPIEGGGGPPQPPNGGGGGTGSLLSERGRRMPQQPAGGGGAPPPGGNGGGNGNGDDNGGGGRPPPQGEMEEMVVMVVMIEMVVEEMIHCHCLIMDSHNTVEVKEIDGCMSYKDPPGPQGQLGQDGRDGQDGQAPQMARGIINVPGVAPAPLDTTGLENSFENLGRTMVDVLTMQQQTN